MAYRTMVEAVMAVSLPCRMMVLYGMVQTARAQLLSRNKEYHVVYTEKVAARPVQIGPHADTVLSRMVNYNTIHTIQPRFDNKQ